MPGLGVRCVADRPWVTGAETAELALALVRLGDDASRAQLLAEVQHLRHDDGAYWTGLVFDEGVRWPVERSAWTAAAVLLAADALGGGTTRALFTGTDLPTGVVLPPRRLPGGRRALHPGLRLRRAAARPPARRGWSGSSSPAG